MPYTVLQITDCHLGIEEGGKLLGLDSDLSLQYVLTHMLSEHQRADALICSGDLVNDKAFEPYRRLIDKLPDYMPQFWLPGNHDDNHCMASMVGENQQFLGSYTLGSWQITLLDSSIPEEVGGSIAPSELDRAVALLEKHHDKHHLFFTHHHLKPVGCQWLDTQVINNAEQVLQVLGQFTQLKLVVCGHVHQDNHQRYKHIDLYTTPSTCIQFKPNSHDFAVGEEMPGYRWIELHDDGSYETAVSRIPFRNLSIEFGSSGY